MRECNLSSVSEQKQKVFIPEKAINHAINVLGEHMYQ